MAIGIAVLDGSFSIFCCLFLFFVHLLCWKKGVNATCDVIEDVQITTTKARSLTFLSFSAILTLFVFRSTTSHAHPPYTPPSFDHHFGYAGVLICAHSRGKINEDSNVKTNTIVTVLI